MLSGYLKTPRMKKCYLFLFLLLAGSRGFSQPVLGFQSFLTGLTAPVDIVNAKDGSNRLFIVQQNGIIRVHSGGSLLATPFINLSSVIRYDVGGERGLLSIAFHPQYATNRYFFVYYNNTAGNVELAQYRTSSSDANVADAASGKILLTITKPFTNHNGCKLLFGTDGNLYFGTGDGGSGGDPQNNAQNLNSLLGKMIRINVDNFNTAPYYTVPSTNPLVGVANTRPEIYGWGLRNPWRWSFDRQTGDMWIADVGQGAWEEVNMIPAAATSGLNYGWRCYEGTHAYDLSQCGTTPATGKTYPIFEYDHSSAGGYSITGGLVYRGTEFTALQGYYMCADYVNPNGWLIAPNGSGGWNVTQQTNFPANVSSFGDAEDGTLYLSTLSGTVYKVLVTGSLPVRLLSFNGESRNGRDVLRWTTTADPSLDHFEIEQSPDGTRFHTIGSLQPTTANAYSYTTTAITGDRYYRLKMRYSTGSVQYSAVLRLTNKSSAGISATVTGHSQLQLTTATNLQQVNLLNMQGQKVQQFGKLTSGSHVLNSSNLPQGVYYLQCIKEDKSAENIRVFIY
jgi:glucose/arabinose dehydrogenase